MSQNPNLQNQLTNQVPGCIWKCIRQSFIKIPNYQEPGTSIPDMENQYNGQKHHTI